MLHVGWNEFVRGDIHLSSNLGQILGQAVVERVGVWVIASLLVPPCKEVVDLLLGWKFSRNPKGRSVACVVLWGMEGGGEFCFCLVDSCVGLSEIISFICWLH